MSRCLFDSRAVSVEMKAVSIDLEMVRRRATGRFRACGEPFFTLNKMKPEAAPFEGGLSGPGGLAVA